MADAGSRRGRDRVFVDLVGNYISFNNRFLNALAQAVLFAIVFGLLTAYFTPAEVTVTPVNP